MAIQETDAKKQGVMDRLKGAERENAILVISGDLKKRHPRADDREIANYFLTAYCPLIAKETGLSGAEKRARMDRFSSQVYRILKSQQ
jgi:hypothetical protein